MRPVLAALTSDPEGPDQVVVVDNASSDDTIAVVKDYAFDLVESEDNVGFAAACHLGSDTAVNPTLVFLGHDTVPENGWLPPLLAALEEPGVGAAMATIVDADRPGYFNTSGGHLTYFGLAWVSDFGQPVPSESGNIAVDFASGGAMAIRRSLWQRLGGFRAQFFMYHEDTDLGWRIRLAGFGSVRVAESRVNHHYEFGRHGRKLEWLERNRILMIMSNYRPATLWVLAPVLLLVELGVVAIAIRHGWLPSKLRSWKGAWNARRYIPVWRAEVEGIRSVPDSVLIATMDHRVSTAPQMVPGFAARLADALFGAYRSLAVRIVRLIERRRRLDDVQG